MAISFKPLDNKTESWDEVQFAAKLDKLAKADLGGRKVKLTKNLEPLKANVFQKMIWSVAKHSNILRKWLLGVHVDTNARLITKMGEFITNTPELKDNTQLITSYNKAIDEFNAFLRKNVGKKTAATYAATHLPDGTQQPDGPKQPPKTPSKTEFKQLKNALMEYLESNKAKYGQFAASHFKKIEADFDTATSLEDFYAKLTQVGTGKQAILPDKIEAIKTFLTQNVGAPQATATLFKQTKTSLFSYLDANKTTFGSTAKLQNLRIERIKADFEKSANLDEFTANMRKKPYSIIEEKITDIENHIKGLMKAPGKPTKPATPKSYTGIANRPFGPNMTTNIKAHPENFPTAAITRPLEHLQKVTPPLLRDSGNFFDYNYNTLNDYIADFDSTVGGKMRGKLQQQGHAFDIHDVQFQNLALFLTQKMNNKQIISAQNDSPALLQLMRARNYAIATRQDIDWDGQPIKDGTIKKQKQLEMESNWRSLVLYDWGGLPDASFDKTPGTEKTAISVTQDDTLTAVEKMAKKHDPAKLAWINMANAHRTGGGYQQGDKAQEEMTVTNCDAIGVLGNVSEILIDGRVGYQKHCHIPPGGNYFHQTTIFTTADDQLITCNSIVHAFADFRKSNSQSEFADFAKGGNLNPHSQAYIDRIKLDMRGVLRTAKAQHQEALILSATGCGAFRHDADAEAKAWASVLKEPEFKGHFKEVVFAIKADKRNPGNFNAFNQHLANLKL
ncbi:MAG: TIGR02452 family protein [Parachlamydia sp.]|nr:MAG: TIGR02452 family protein [Parachlamydia sp.]